MKRINEHADFLSLMHKRGRNAKDRKQLIEMANRGEIDACCEVFLNAVRGNIHLTPSLARSMKRHQKQCQKLLNKKIGLAQKKKILINQTGGFLPLLISALAPVAMSLVKGLVAGT